MVSSMDHRHVPLLALLVSLLWPSITARAQVGADATVRPLSAILIGRESQSASEPYALHPSGDLVFAASGVLRTDASGATRWHHADESIADVAVSSDGSVFGMARMPIDRPTRVDIVRFDEQGRITWKRTLHRGALDPRTYPDIVGAANGESIVCSTLTRGGMVLDRLDARGRVLWSRRLDASAECSTVAVSAQGDIFWTGATNGGATAIVEKLDASGTSIWRTLFDGQPITHELTLAGDGGVLVGGSLDGPADLLPGPREHRVTPTAYQSFVVRLDASGVGEWAWVGGYAPLRSILTRGDETIVVEQGDVTRLDRRGTVITAQRFGLPRHDGMLSQPFVSVTGAMLGRDGRLVLALGIPEPDAIGLADYLLFTDQPYVGPRGSVLAWPGW